MHSHRHICAAVSVIVLAQLLRWSTCGWHSVVNRQLPYQKPILYFQIQAQSSWDERNWCCAIVLPWVLQMRLHHSASAGANNSPCQPFSASVVNIDPGSGSSHYPHYATFFKGCSFKAVSLIAIAMKGLHGLVLHQNPRKSGIRISPIQPESL